LRKGGRPGLSVHLTLTLEGGPSKLRGDGSVAKFELLIELTKDGAVRHIEMPIQTAVVGCLFIELLKFQQPDAVRFATPPHAPYWVILEVDPAAFVVAAK
jgi:hypothetical protein